MMTLLVALILGSGFAWLICTQIVKPVVRISNVAKKISENDFSVRASESIPSFELQQLAKNINQMADKIQRDINDLNNYNYLLLRQNRNMAEFEDIRKTIVSKMTHELKTPLAIISSQVEMLQYEYDDTKKDYYFSSIMEEIEKMSGLISNILNNSFTDSSLPSTLMARDDLSVLLDTLIPKYTCWMTSSNIRFSTSVQEDCFAVFDPMQIEQVVNNYIMNAWNHTKPGHQIILTCVRTKKASTVLSITKGATFRKRNRNAYGKASTRRINQNPAPPQKSAWDFLSSETLSASTGAPAACSTAGRVWSSGFACQKRNPHISITSILYITKV